MDTTYWIKRYAGATLYHCDRPRWSIHHRTSTKDERRSSSQKAKERSVSKTGVGEGLEDVEVEKQLKNGAWRGLVVTE